MLPDTMYRQEVLEIGRCDDIGLHTKVYGV